MVRIKFAKANKPAKTGGDEDNDKASRSRRPTSRLAKGEINRQLLFVAPDWSKLTSSGLQQAYLALSLNVGLGASKEAVEKVKRHVGRVRSKAPEGSMLKVNPKLSAVTRNFVGKAADANRDANLPPLAVPPIAMRGRVAAPLPKIMSPGRGRPAQRNMYSASK